MGQLRRWEISLLIGIVVAILLGSFTTFAKDCAAVRENVVRLHILANSNTAEDQQLKLKVRDAVLVDTSQVFESATSQADAREKAEQNLEHIRRVAQETVQQQGYDYRVETRVVNMYFTTREYDDVTLPAGYYDAVRIEIGAGTGNNWWCVMFPPMCVPAASEKTDMPVEQQIRSLGSPSRFKPKFAVVELVESLRDRMDTPSATDEKVDE